jgi:uncharacterized protein
MSVLVVYLRKSDRFHQWAVAQWVKAGLPVFTCDAVISEACFLFRDLPHIQRAILVGIYYVCTRYFS